MATRGWENLFMFLRLVSYLGDDVLEPLSKFQRLIRGDHPEITLTAKMVCGFGENRRLNEKS